MNASPARRVLSHWRGEARASCRRQYGSTACSMESPAGWSEFDLSLRRREVLRPVDDAICRRRLCEGDAHLRELRSHDIRAVPRALKPRGDDVGGVRLTGRDVLA